MTTIPPDSPSSSIDSRPSASFLPARNPSRFVAPVAEIPEHDTEVLVAFFVCGLINNLSYVVMLSGALDLIASSGSSVGAGAILLADIIPTLIIKATAPFFMHHFPYSVKIAIASIAGVVSFFLAAYSDTIEGKMVGVVCASICSGLGEITFLAFQAFFHQHSVASWSSGTGAAGLVGSLVYLLFTSVFNITPTNTLFILSPLPVMTTILYFFPLRYHVTHHNLDHHPLEGPGFESDRVQDEILTSADFADDDTSASDRVLIQSQPKLIHPKKGRGFRSITVVSEEEYQDYQSSTPSFGSASLGMGSWEKKKFKEKFNQVREFIIPYMGPLFLVYFSEYLINSGVTPVVVFENSPFDTETHYRVFSFCYQAGVFISRSSVRVFHIQRLWIPSIVQAFLFFVFFFHVLFYMFPNVWFIVALTVFEGLLGGTVYASAFYSISQNVRPRKKCEFAMGIVSLADTCGISLAGAISLPLEAWLLKNGHRRTTRQPVSI